MVHQTIFSPLQQNALWSFSYLLIFFQGMLDETTTQSSDFKDYELVFVSPLPLGQFPAGYPVKLKAHKSRTVNLSNQVTCGVFYNSKVLKYQTIKVK